MIELGAIILLQSGNGEGAGSCPAPPFRSDPDNIAWPDGCPDFAPCCSEYGYCQTRAAWEDGTIFRDCNGESNGLDLPLRTLQAELIEKNAGRETADDDLLGLDGTSLEELVAALEEIEREKAEEADSISDDIDSDSDIGNDGNGGGNSNSIQFPSGNSGNTGFGKGGKRGSGNSGNNGKNGFGKAGSRGKNQKGGFGKNNKNKKGNRFGSSNGNKRKNGNGLKSGSKNGFRNNGSKNNFVVPLNGLYSRPS